MKIKSTLQSLAILALVTLALAGQAAASERPRRLYQTTAVISSPASFATVRGNVSVTGTANHPQFQRYTLEFAPEPGEGWVFFAEGTVPVNGGLLGTWNTAALPDGTYGLRLRVIRQDGNFDEVFQRGIVVANTAPTATPTPFEPPTIPVPAEPTATPTVEATATPVTVTQPEIPTPTPRPSASPSPTAEVAADGSDDGGFLGDSFDLDTVRGAFTRGVAVTAAIFLAVGAFFGLKRLLTWLWYLIAP